MRRMMCCVLRVVGRDGALRRPRRRAERQATQPNAEHTAKGFIRSARCYAGGDIAARCPYQPWRIAHILSIIVPFLLFAFLANSSAQTLSDNQLKKISFDQKLGAQVSRDLQFRDENGRPVRLGDFFGRKPTILVLGYYRCPMLCSFVLNGMIGSLQDIKWEIGNQFDVINVSIDPHETSELAAAKKKSYVRRYGRHDASPGWHFLTGDEPQIRELAREVGFGYAYDSRVKEYAHPSGLIILTPEGKVSHYLSGVVYSTKELNDALVDASQRKVGSPIRQLFLLCFHYSPITGKYGWMIMLAVRICGMTALALVGWCLWKGIRSRPAVVARPLTPTLSPDGGEGEEPSAIARNRKNLSRL